MPYIEVKTNVQVKNHKEFLKELSSYFSKALSKSLVYISVSLQDNLSMFFNNSDDPAYNVSVLSIGLNSDINKTISKELSEILEKELGVSSNRGYIFFNDPGRANCGWSGSTFA